MALAATASAASMGQTTLLCAHLRFTTAGARHHTPVAATALPIGLAPGLPARPAVQAGLGLWHHWWVPTRQLPGTFLTCSMFTVSQSLWVHRGLSACWSWPTFNPWAAVPSAACLPVAAAELFSLCRALLEAGIRPMADIVINHRCADYQDENGVWNRWAGAQPC